MCCDICPFYDECEELEELQDECCRECPDFEDCQNREEPLPEPDAESEADVADTSPSM